jgi:nitroimidazol reductase NimA-like FMN-containing flavoprotein (pyridoxamine 5'-phosphate oxidase superfamily)/ribosomal protein S18 acetylase RimI-like enzyme
MRKEIFRMDAREAIELLGRARVVHLATTTPSGEPVLRALHAAVIGDRILFHGAPAGEKAETVGRAAVVCAEETVASIPSYFVDPERACPATTLYRSVQAHGTLEEVDDPVLKAAMLQALMAKHQPEGGHVPIDADHPLYRKAVAGVMVLAVRMERVDGKAKLGQNRTPAESTRILELLWARGEPGDALAVDLVRAANPRAPTPAFLACPAGATLRCALGEADADEAAAMLAPAYWNEGASPDRVARSLLGSAAWVGARDEAGKLVATARALSDGARRAWIYDVIVAPAWRGRGLGDAMMRLLLAHPSVRHVEKVLLNTRDVERFYEKHGFRVRSVRKEPTPAMEMVLERP